MPRSGCNLAERERTKQKKELQKSFGSIRIQGYFTGIACRAEEYTLLQRAHQAIGLASTTGVIRF